jgi:hypothetical protein
MKYGVSLQRNLLIQRSVVEAPTFGDLTTEQIIAGLL